VACFLTLLRRKREWFARWLALNSEGRVAGLSPCIPAITQTVRSSPASLSMPSLRPPRLPRATSISFGRFEGVILDLGLPGLDGYDIPCQLNCGNNEQGASMTVVLRDLKKQLTQQDIAKVELRLGIDFPTELPFLPAPAHWQHPTAELVSVSYVATGERDCWYRLYQHVPARWLPREMDASERRGGHPD
jgi:hypothetical protein